MVSLSTRGTLFELPEAWKNNERKKEKGLCESLIIDAVFALNVALKISTFTIGRFSLCQLKYCHNHLRSETSTLKRRSPTCRETSFIFMFGNFSITLESTF